MIIKDYAYEEQCDLPIQAGSIVSYVGINEENADLDFNVYVSGNNIYLLVPDELLYENYIIYSEDGKLLYKNSLNHVENEIYFLNPPGIYFMEITTKGNSITKSFIIF